MPAFKSHKPKKVPNMLRTIKGPERKIRMTVQFRAGNKLYIPLAVAKRLSIPAGSFIKLMVDDNDVPYLSVHKKRQPHSHKLAKASNSSTLSVQLVPAAKDFGFARKGKEYPYFKAERVGEPNTKKHRRIRLDLEGYEVPVKRGRKKRKKRN